MKTCKRCKEPFKAYNTIQKHCVSCSIEIAKEKQQAKANKEWRAKKKKLKEGLKTRSQKINDARKIFQQFIRARDKNLPCISCGTETSTYWDAGHYLKAELYTGLIFNEDNCHKQCRKCNSYLGGNEIEYRISLEDRIGKQRLKTLEDSRNALRSYVWEDSELEEIKKKYKNLLKSLQGK